MDASVAILKRVQEDKGKGAYRCRNHRIERTVQESLRQRHPALHERGNIFRARADEMHILSESPGGLADEVLEITPIMGCITWIHNTSLKADQCVFVGRIEG